MAIKKFITFICCFLFAFVFLIPQSVTAPSVMAETKKLELPMLDVIIEEPKEQSEEKKLVYFSDSIKVMVPVEVKEKVIEQLNSMTYEIQLLSTIAWNEAGAIPSITHQSAVIWCILNRVDSEKFGTSIIEVATSPNQFAYYGYINGEKLQWLAADVLTRWLLEREGYVEVGRTLPQEYLYFIGDGARNHFRTTYNSKATWNWSCESPYEN